ncbi:MAG: MFS transporter [Candidatus Dormibacteria bacterium]
MLPLALRATRAVAPGVADQGGSYRWIALSATSLGALLASLNMSTLVIALPALLRSLHTGLLDVVWVLLSYMLAQTATVLSVGRLGDLWGRKRLYVAGFAIFTALALASGFAGSAGVLILLRVVAGVGGALMLANSGAIVTDAFPRRQLGLALGVNTMVIAVGAAVGPVLGGWLTSFGWQWVFWFNVPVGLVGTVASLVLLREQRTRGPRQRIDWWGNAVLVAALSGLLIALSTGGIEGWLHPSVVAGALLFVVGAPLFVVLERRVRDPLLDLALFRNRLFAIANLAQFINGTARMGVLFLLVFFFQGPEQKDAVTAGLLVVPLPLLMFVFSPVSGWLSDRVGSRIPATAGLVLTGLGLGGMAATIGVGSSYALLAMWLAVVGIGGGLFNSPNASAIMASVPAVQRGVASGVRMLVAFSGSMISIAFVLAIVTSSLPTTVMLSIFSGVSSGLDPAQVSPFISGLRLALLVLAVLSLVSSPLSLLRGAETSRRQPLQVAPS